MTLNGLHRGIAGVASTGADGRLRVEVEERPDENPPRVKTAELEREYRATVEEILELREADPRVRDFLRAVSDAGALADTTGYAPDGYTWAFGALFILQLAGLLWLMLSRARPMARVQLAAAD